VGVNTSRFSHTPTLPHFCTPLLLVCLCFSCGRAKLQGAEDVPPGTKLSPGIFVDVAPRWSHDGKKIVFLRCTTDRKFQLYAATSDLFQASPLLQPEVVSPDRPYKTGRTGYRAADGPAWSPNDDKIGFSRIEWHTFENGERLPGTALWTYDTRTGKSAPLAIHPEKYTGAFYYYRSLTWSPDGKYIAFVGVGVQGQAALFVRSLAGTKPVVETPRYDQYGDSGWPAWSLQRHALVFRQGILRASTADPIETLRLISPSGTEARRLFATTPQRFREKLLPAKPNSEFDEDDRQDIAPRIAGISWSPDGSHIAFTLTPDPMAPESYKVCVIATEGTASIKVVSPNDGHGYQYPVWIDNKTIGGLKTAKEGFDAMSLPLDTRQQARVLCHVPTDDLDWSPDRRHIVCAEASKTEAGKTKPATLTTLRVYETGL
jgi:dipeptidyl aminopeptidase/acylaminoacyl peptidase